MNGDDPLFANRWRYLFQANINATLELCHSGNEPSVEHWQEDVHAVRSGGERHLFWR